LVRVTADVVGI